MAREAKRTADHEKIRRWAEARSGKPAAVIGTGRKGEPGVLRIDFPGYRGAETLKEITWDNFFKKFDREQLDFLYQDKTASGKPSRFCKLVNREKTTGGRR
jgi:hypothetical protein